MVVIYKKFNSLRNITIDDGTKIQGIGINAIKNSFERILWMENNR